MNEDVSALPTTAGTSCNQFQAGQAPVLAQVRYRTRNGLITRLEPREVTYWTRIQAPAPSFSVDVLQSSTHSTLFGLANSGKVQLYDAACVQRPDLRTVTVNAGQAALAITGATPGSFYLISVRYSTRPLVGQAAPNPPTAHYDFETRLNGTLVDRAIPGLDLVKK